MIRDLLFHVHELSDCDIIPREWTVMLRRRSTPTIGLGLFADMVMTESRGQNETAVPFRLGHTVNKWR